MLFVIHFNDEETEGQASCVICYIFLLLCNKLLQLSSLKQHTFIIQFLSVMSPAQPCWVLCSGSQKAAIKVSAGLHSNLDLQVLFHAQMVVGRIWFLASIGVSFSCQLQAGNCLLFQRSLPRDPLQLPSHNMLAYFYKATLRKATHLLVKCLPGLALCTQDNLSFYYFKVS